MLAPARCCASVCPGTRWKSAWCPSARSVLRRLRLIFILPAPRRPAAPWSAPANFWRAQGKPSYREDILLDPEEDLDGDGGGLSAEDAADPLYQQALEITYSSGAISASYLQRRLRIGYNKAARFVEMMEAQGVVGPADGAKPRPVIGPRP